MATYFTFFEMIDSQAARAYNVNNMPNSLDIYRNLDALMTYVLDPLRKAVNCPIYVNSGYRSEKLNDIVRGSLYSQHMNGEAADIQCRSKKKTLEVWSLLKDFQVPFDQAIYYTTRGFIHISYKRKGDNRGELLYNTD